MSLIVEDGTGLANAESYVSVAAADGYHTDRRNLAWADALMTVDDKEAALRRATTWLDATYRARFPGYPTRGRAQALEWPRSGAYTYVPDDGRSTAYLSGYSYGYDPGYSYIAPNVVPREIVSAVCEAALRELAEPGSLAPDLERGGAIRRIQAGSVSVEYAGGSSPNTTFQTVGMVLASLLMPGRAYSGKAVRG